MPVYGSLKRPDGCGGYAASVHDVDSPQANGTFLKVAKDMAVSENETATYAWLKPSFLLEHSRS
jgi:hypothetical protein